MRFALSVLAALALAAALGLGLTWWTVANGLPASGLVIGPWRAEPSVGGLEADPYQRAGASTRGEAPLAHGDGLSFTASADQSGRALVTSCDYQLEGELPPARLWTLAFYHPDGRVLDRDPTRPTLSSANIVRTVGEPIRISASNAARPGNWARLVGDGVFVMRLTLYDTALGTPIDRADPKALLSVKRGACR